MNYIKGSCEDSNGPLGSVKYLEVLEVATQMATPQEGFSYVELVICVKVVILTGHHFD
jgi:hypothetical protein